MPRSIFITATDTGAGKTWVTTRLLRSLLDRGESAQALKPVASGVLPSGINEDVQALMDVSRMPVSALNFLTFQTPVAPSLAAHREQVQWQPNQLLGWLQEREKAANLTLIEGVGGLMSPLLGVGESSWLVQDWLQAMPHAEVMLVVPLRLGCISQALVHCSCLAAVNRLPQWVVLNDMAQVDDDDTPRIISQHLLGMYGRAPDVVVVRQASDLASIL